MCVCVYLSVCLSVCVFPISNLVLFVDRRNNYFLAPASQIRSERRMEVREGGEGGVRGEIIDKPKQIYTYILAILFSIFRSLVDMVAAAD